MPKRISLLYSKLLHTRSVNSMLLWWVSQKRFYRHLMVNIMIGIMITMLLHSFDNSQWLRQEEDDAFDWVMAMQLGTSQDKLQPKFAFLDIDEATYRNWEEPLHIPRNKLLDIIKFAVSGKPRLIVVDVDLSRCGQCLEYDHTLINYLNKYHDQPPIVLPQLFREPIDGESRRTLRASFFNQKEPAGANVFLASPLFELDENDLRLRRWRLWEFTSNQEVIPSVELLAVALINSNRNAKDIIEDVKTQIHDDSAKINIQGIGELKTDSDDIGQRIIYSIPGTLDNGKTYPENFIRRSVLPITKNISPAIKLTPADQCPAKCSTESPMPGEKTGTDHPDLSWLEDRVVVIGASFGDSRDIYATPIGQMPGAMVIVNAMNSLYEYGQIEKPGGFWILVIEIILIIIMSIAFASFDYSFLGMLVSSTIIIVIMLPLSFYLFKYGVWLDFAIPLIAVQLHRMHASFEENKVLAQSNREDDSDPFT